MPRLARAVVPGVPHHVTQRGNRTQLVADGVTTTYTYNAANELTQEQTVGGDTVQYDYDGRGNCIERHVVGGHTTYFEYNSRNLVTRIDSTDPCVHALTFEYNALGQRIRMTRACGATRRYIWDGLNLLLELDGDGGVVRRYTHGHAAIHGVGSLLDVEDELGNHYWYHCDPVGGVLRLTDASERVVQLYEYTPFGRLLTHLGLAPNDFTFPATYLRVPGLADLRLSPKRTYDAGNGRFVQRDLRRTPNRYRFGRNAPGTHVDPDGRGAIYVDPFQLLDPEAQAEGYLVGGGAWAQEGGLSRGVRPPDVGMAPARSLGVLGVGGFTIQAKHAAGEAAIPISGWRTQSVSFRPTDWLDPGGKQGIHWFAIKTILTPEEIAALPHPKAWPSVLGDMHMSSTGEVIGRPHMTRYGGHPLGKGMEHWEMGPEVDLAYKILQQRTLLRCGQTFLLSYAITSDVLELHEAWMYDLEGPGGTGRHTLETAVGMGGRWAGAIYGGKASATLFGAAAVKLYPHPLAIGASVLVGGVVGGVVGAIGGEYGTRMAFNALAGEPLPVPQLRFVDPEDTPGAYVREVIKSWVDAEIRKHIKRQQQAATGTTIPPPPLMGTTLPEPGADLPPPGHTHDSWKEEKRRRERERQRKLYGPN